MEAEDGMRARSFRYEDYNTRRVFLRSYPLHWGAESEAEESAASEAAAKYNSKEEPGKVGKKPIKKIILAVVHWGGERILVFRRIKHKITIYVVNCVPMNFKVPTGLISIK
ncbi:hypothetical protein ACS0TY_019459 [Phlomoides rotata]